MPPEARASSLDGDAARRIRVEASSVAVRHTLAELRAAWAREGLGEALVDRAELVLAEALNNVVEHAHRDRPDGAIELEARCGAGALTLRLYDDGHAIPGGALPGGDLPRPGAGTAETPEGGFGWYLIRALADGLEYRRTARGNCLCIRLTDRPEP